MSDLTSLIDTSEVNIDTQGTQDTGRLAAAINRLSDILEGGIQINSTVAFNATASDPTDGSSDPTDGSSDPTDGSSDPTDGSSDPTDGSSDPTDGSSDPTANN